MHGPLLVPSKSNNRRDGTYLDQLLRWAEERSRVGVPRQTICDALLRGPDLSLDGFLEMGPDEREDCLDEKGARIKAARQVVQVMVNRDLNARTCEREGQIEEAIRLYEANVTDKCAAITPYERLRAIYTERQDYPNAIRVCYAFLIAAKNGAEAEQFQGYLVDLLSVRDGAPRERRVLDIVIATG